MVTTTTVIILPGANQCVLGPSRCRPAHSLSSWTSPLQPGSSRAPPIASLLLLSVTQRALGLFGCYPTSAALHKGTQSPPICSRDHCESKPLWPQTKSSSCEICTEKGKKEISPFPCLILKTRSFRKIATPLVTPLSPFTHRHSPSKTPSTPTLSFVLLWRSHTPSSTGEGRLDA